VPPPGAPDPCGCRPQQVTDILLDTHSPSGRGSGLLSWRTTAERDLVGFNVVSYDSQGRRTVLTPSLIPCQVCTGGLGASYGAILVKHKSGKDLFVEMVRTNGVIQTFGPATKR
jgi:uncharacterized membrane protein YsdA (DUF1294 family)